MEEFQKTQELEGTLGYAFPWRWNWRRMFGYEDQPDTRDQTDEPDGETDPDDTAEG